MNDQPILEHPKSPFAIPIRWKLLAATAIVGAVAAVIAIVGLKTIRELNRNLTQTVNFLTTNVTLASLVKQDLITATRAERNMMLAQTEDGTKRFATVVDEVGDMLDDHLSELDTVVSEEDQRQLNLFSEKWADWRENHENVRRLTALNSDIEARAISVGEASEAIDRLERALEIIVQQNGRELDASEQTNDYRLSTAAARKRELSVAVWTAALEMQRAEKDLILSPTETEMHLYEEKSETLEKSLESRIKQLGDALHGNQTDAMENVRKGYEDYVNANHRIRTVAGEKSNLFAYHFVNEVGGPIAGECESLLDSLIEKNEKRMLDYRRGSQRTYMAARNILLSVGLLGIVVSVAVSSYTGHGLARRLSTLSRYANTIQTSGDLSKPAPRLGGDEVGLLAESFERMRQSLHDRTLRLREQTARLSELSQTLQAKNKEMEQFVYTVSHDLKSPLVSCKGLLGFLREDVADGNYEAIVDSAHRLDEATDHLNQIIDDLLMLSRIGRKPLQLTNVDLRAVLEELTDELSERIADTNAQVVIEPSLPNVLADPSDARRVFENLLTNALKYGGAASDPRITVGGMSHPDEVRFFVRDNGPGIDSKYHEKIFGLFERLDTDQPGTGLGLASVAKIMSLHRGRVWVESETGQGATFWIAFPHLSRPAGI